MFTIMRTAVYILEQGARVHAAMLYKFTKIFIKYTYNENLAN